MQKEEKQRRKKKNVLLFLKSLFPIADLYLCWKGHYSPRAATLMAVSLGEGSVRREAWGVLQSFIHSADGHCTRA